MRDILYILNGKEPIPSRDPVKHSRWMEMNFSRLRVAQHHFLDHDLMVSTVFTGRNYNFNFDPEEDDRPICFETAIEHKGEWFCHVRSRTWDQSLIIHQVMLAIAVAHFITEEDPPTARAMKFTSIPFKRT